MPIRTHLLNLALLGFLCLVPLPASSQVHTEEPVSIENLLCHIALGRNLSVLQGVMRNFETAILNRGLVETPERVLNDLVASLPLISVQPGENEIQAISRYLQVQFGPGRSVEFEQPLTVPTSGARVSLFRYRVKDGTIGVLKIFRRGPYEIVKEVAALQLLNDLSLKEGMPVKVLDLARVGTAEKWSGVLFMSYSGAPDLESDLRRAHTAQIDEHLVILARGLAEVHRKFRRVDAAHPNVLQFVRYEVDRQRAQLADPSTSSRILSLLGSQNAEATQLLHAFQKIVARSVARYEMVRVAHPTATFGDSHPGNYSVLTQIAQKAVFFDVQELMWSVQADGRGVFGTTDPMNDIGRFTGGLIAIGTDAGLPHSEIVRIRNLFLDAYAVAAKDDTESVSDFHIRTQTALDFFELRVLTIMLKMPLKISDATRSKILQEIPKWYHLSD